MHIYFCGFFVNIQVFGEREMNIKKQQNRKFLHIGIVKLELTKNGENLPISVHSSQNFDYYSLVIIFSFLCSYFLLFLAQFVPPSFFLFILKICLSNNLRFRRKSCTFSLINQVEKSTYLFHENNNYLRKRNQWK